LGRLKTLGKRGTIENAGVENTRVENAAFLDNKSPYLGNSAR